MERLSIIVLALPAYLLLRAQDSVPNGQLHPVLSCLFRVTDGLRLMLHQMLFLPLYEAVRDPEQAIEAEQVFDYAERNFGFFSPHGVCAGPVAMIKEFLHVIFEGDTPGVWKEVELDPAVGQALSVLDDVIDYGLRALQVHAVSFAFFPIMLRGYDQVWQSVRKWNVDSASFKQFKHALREARRLAANSLLVDEPMRASRLRAYQDMYEQCAYGLNVQGEHGSFEAAIRSEFLPQHQEALKNLITLMAKRWNLQPQCAELNSCAESLFDYLKQEQVLVRTVCRLQQSIQKSMQRAPAIHEFEGAFFDTYNELLQLPARVPYLTALIQDTLQVRIRITSDCIEVCDASVQAAGQESNSTGMGPVNPRAMGTEVC